MSMLNMSVCSYTHITFKALIYFTNLFTGLRDLLEKFIDAAVSAKKFRFFFIEIKSNQTK